MKHLTPAWREREREKINIMKVEIKQIDTTMLISFTALLNIPKLYFIYQYTHNKSWWQVLKI